MAARRKAMPPKGQQLAPDVKARWRERWDATRQASRAARMAAMAAMTPEERLAKLAEAQRKRAAAGRAGWRTRRKNMGLDPDRPAPPGRAVRVYVADLETLARFHPDAKTGLHLALQGLALAMEAGALEWTGEGWRVF